MCPTMLTTGICFYCSFYDPLLNDTGTESISKNFIVSLNAFILDRVFYDLKLINFSYTTQILVLFVTSVWDPD